MLWSVKSTMILSLTSPLMSTSLDINLYLNKSLMSSSGKNETLDTRIDYNQKVMIYSIPSITFLAFPLGNPGTW